VADEPGGPIPEADKQGKWWVANGQILLSHQNRTHECRVTWMADNLFVIEPLDGKGCARYERTEAAQDQPDSVVGEPHHKQSEQ
jgi:hypothetical protein